jgi:predicted dehydrogenase
MDSLGLGVVGCGAISGIYFENFRKFGLTVAACADLDPEKARIAAEKWGVPRCCTAEQLLDAPDVGVVVNLTVPKAHFEISLAALQSGKHVYVEKPLAVELEEGRKLVEEADARGLKIGCAPDTVLGAGTQTCRKLIEEGAIGAPVGANAFMLCPGHESWHPSPEFYYERGGGPMFDMGPYYLSSLITLFGGIRSVSGLARITSPTRTITSEPKRGAQVAVETPTHISSLLEFENGAIANLTTSFDVQRTTLPCIEVSGTEGSILVPDPNSFGGPVRIFRKGSDNWADVALTHPHAENSRGLGVRDLVEAVGEQRPNRASGRLALHVLEAMHATLESARQGARILLEPLVARDDAMPLS